MNELVAIAQRLRQAVDGLVFSAPVTHVYNPLHYAWEPHRRYIERYGQQRPRQVLLVGMNPGPWGMAQTGVPFGEVGLARDWLGLEAPVGKPQRQHAKRPVNGFACTRSEVSGARLWGAARRCFGTPEHFFGQFFVYNYCPLLFLEDSGRNRTPDKLSASERAPLWRACDQALRDVIAYFAPEFVVGIGKFAEGRIRAVCATEAPKVGAILHPSPANPKANQNWVAEATRQLHALGIALPESGAPPPDCARGEAAG